MTNVAIEELSEQEAKEALLRIASILYPGDDPDAEWSSDEIEEVAQVIERLGLKPPSWPQGKFKIIGKLDVTADVEIKDGCVHIVDIYVNERPEWNVTPQAIAFLADDPIDADSITEQQVSLIDAALNSGLSESGITFEWDNVQPIKDLLGVTLLRIEGKAEIVVRVELLDDGRMRIQDAFCLGLELPIPADGRVQDEFFDWVDLAGDEAERISYGLLSIRADAVSIEHEDVVSTGGASV